MVAIWLKIRYVIKSAANKAHEKIGMWLSLVERLTGGQEAAGSSPVIPSRKPPRKRWLFARNDRIIDCNTEGARQEPQGAERPVDVRYTLYAEP